MSPRLRLRLALALFGGCLFVPVMQSQGGTANSYGEEPAGMLVPGVLTGAGYSVEFASEVPRTNYFNGSISFGSAYDSNATSQLTTQQSDVSYYVHPSIALKQSRARARWALSYSPGFTFYQHVTAVDRQDQNLGLQFNYRLAPHVTFWLQDQFLMTSNPLYQFSENTDASGNSRPPVSAIVPPISDQRTNDARTGLTYQFGPNSMLGGSGSFYMLEFPKRSQVPGLYDSTGRGAQVFYSHRMWSRHYISGSYQFQSFLSQPGDGETNGHTALLSYTLYMNEWASVSLFAGPEYARSTGNNLAPFESWSPAYGASANLQGQRTSLGVDFAKRLSQGLGLSGATHSSAMTASVRRRMTKNITGSISGQYSENIVLNTVSASSTRGHMISGTASLDRAIGQHLAIELGFTKIHQTYATVPSASIFPDRDRGWISLSYEFERPLGR